MPIFGGWTTPTATGGTGYVPLGTVTTANTSTTCYTSATTASALMQAYANQTQTTGGTASWYQNQWIDDVTPSQYFALAQQRVPIYRAYTAEQQRLIAERQAEMLRAEQERREKNELARTRARELLLSHLRPHQRDTFERNKWFIVEGGKSRQVYRIRDVGHCSGNVDVMQSGRVTHRLCCHCDGVPLYDQLLAQKIMLEYDEDNFLRLANRHAA